MTEREVWERRLLSQISAQGLGAIQEISTRKLLVLTAHHEVLTEVDVRAMSAITATRHFLRGYGRCGVHGRRCFLDDRHVCMVR